jgi:hypothetical protein
MEELFLHSLPDHERAVALGMHGGTQRTHYADRHHDGGDERGDKHDDGHHLTEIYGLQEHRVQEEIGCDDESRDDLVPEHPLEDVLLEYLFVHLRLQDDFVDIDDVGDLDILPGGPAELGFVVLLEGEGDMVVVASEVCDTTGRTRIHD